jgi:hypothetical protein
MPSRPFAAGVLSTFARPLKDGFAGIAVLTWLRADESAALDVLGHVGVEYEPAHDLLAALVGSKISGIVLTEPTLAARVSSSNEVSRTAEVFARFVSQQTPLLGQLADVDAVIKLLRQRRAVSFDASMAGRYAMEVLDAEPGASESPNGDVVEEGELITALLAGAGRYDEARRALAEYGPPGSEDEGAREYRRFVRQLTRFLDAAGTLLLPTSPPQWAPHPPRPKSPPSPVQSFVQHLPEARAQQEAVEAVRVVSHGKTRAELRTLLEEELNERGVSIDPGVIEVSVDFLATVREPFGRTRVALRAAQALRELVSWRKPIEVVPECLPEEPEADTEAEAEPESWLKLPDRAAYPVSSFSHRRVTVGLDPSARAFLDRILRYGSTAFGHTGRVVEVWLTWDPESPAKEACLNVHIGAERVGRLGPDAAEFFRPALEAAAEREEDPWTRAHLTTTSGEMPYTLEIALPELGGYE